MFAMAEPTRHENHLLNLDLLIRDVFLEISQRLKDQSYSKASPFSVLLISRKGSYRKKTEVTSDYLKI